MAWHPYANQARRAGLAGRVARQWAGVLAGVPWALAGQGAVCTLLLRIVVARKTAGMIPAL